MRIRIFHVMNLCCVMLCSGCSSVGTDSDKEQFNQYWHQGKAELSRFVLEQAQYGQVHRGDAVLIFVTEDFLLDKQVKREHSKLSKSVNVLKLNFMRKFNTGIYPYSIMSSVFTPVHIDKRKHSLKLTVSTQEWCGHTYTQLNYRKGSFAVKSHSYFENEGDQEISIKPDLLEDEIWTRIRLAPSSLPVGDIRIIPGFQYARLEHVPTKVEKAYATLEILNEPTMAIVPIMQYKVQYKELQRELTINFEGTFPFMILAWEEVYLTQSDSSPKKVHTRAVKTNTLMIDYWNKNKVSDLHYREKLGLK